MSATARDTATNARARRCEERDERRRAWAATLSDAELQALANRITRPNAHSSVRALVSQHIGATDVRTWPAALLAHLDSARHHLQLEGAWNGGAAC